MMYLPWDRKLHLLSLFALLLLDGLSAVDGKKDENNKVETDAPNIDEPRCDLCENGSLGLKWPDTFINSQGTTCVERLLDIYVKYKPESTQCKWQIIQHRNRCCTGDIEPPDIVQAPTESPGAYQGSGGDNICELCHNGRFPAETSMVINMLDIDIGAAPCDDYYKIGQDGLIPPHLCEPIQYFAYEPCGCEYGIEVDNSQADERVEDDTESPTASPSTGHPTSLPTKSLTMSPTDTPSASPNTAAPSTVIPTTPLPTKSLTMSSTDTPTASPNTIVPSTINPTKSVSTDAPTTNTATTTSIPTDETEIVSPTFSGAPTIEFRQARVPLDEGKDSIAKLGSDNRGGAGGQRRRRLKGR